MTAAPNAGFSFRNFRLYLSERFPPALNGLAIFLLYSCALLASSRMQGLPLPRPLPWAAGYLWALCVFYHLRVLDDLKDREADVRAYPERILSRGLLSYRHLAVTGAAALAVETGLAAWLGPKILALHAVVAAYSLLMYKEFFVRAWLKRHLFWYGISHMLILAAIDFAILQMPAPRGPLARMPGFVLFSFLGFCMTFSLEVARKIRVPAAERPEVDTYSKVFGIGGSLALAAGFQAAVMALAWALRPALGLPLWFHIVTLITWILVGAAFAFRGAALTEAASRKLDKTAALFYLQFYACLLGVLAWGT